MKTEKNEVKKMNQDLLKQNFKTKKHGNQFRWALFKADGTYWKTINNDELKELFNINVVMLFKLGKNKFYTFFLADATYLNGVGLITSVIPRKNNQLTTTNKKRLIQALSLLNKLNSKLLNTMPKKIKASVKNNRVIHIRTGYFSIQDFYNNDELNVLKYSWLNPMTLERGENTKDDIEKRFKDKKIVLITQNEIWKPTKQELENSILVIDKRFEQSRNVLFSKQGLTTMYEYNKDKMLNVVSQQKFYFGGLSLNNKKVVKVTPYITGKELNEKHLMTPLEILTETLSDKKSKYNLFFKQHVLSQKDELNTKSLIFVFKKKNNKLEFEKSLLGSDRALINRYNNYNRINLLNYNYLNDSTKFVFGVEIKDKYVVFNFRNNKRLREIEYQHFFNKVQATINNDNYKILGK